jgi:hypothetical protein
MAQNNLKLLRYKTLPNEQKKCTWLLHRNLLLPQKKIDSSRLAAWTFIRRIVVTNHFLGSELVDAVYSMDLDFFDDLRFVSV